VGADELNAIRDLSCSYNVDIDYDSCNNKCDSPCKEYIYDTQVSTSGAWPGVSYEMAFYKEFVAKQTYAQQFSAYENITNDENMAQVG